ncbi:MAG: GNAT family N-acetyltransferase [Deferribacteres bacterium]|nr:GNAT family N-acetyltransferase [Deferribacteres bacterium]
MYPIQYIADKDVDNSLDQALRRLLTVCFTKPGDEVFQKRRYFIDPPIHRWIIADKEKLVAHVAAHEKTIIHNAQKMTIGGVAEVCVHPEYRRQGLVRAILLRAHALFRAKKFPFAALCGDAAIYTSSGYVEVSNLHFKRGEQLSNIPGAMVCKLGDQKWPKDEVVLLGNLF